MKRCSCRNSWGGHCRGFNVSEHTDGRLYCDYHRPGNHEKRRGFFQNVVNRRHQVPDVSHVPVQQPEPNPEVLRRYAARSINQ